MNTAILIPSLNPNEKLIALAHELSENGFKNIVVVNDGSSPEHLHIFEEIKDVCTVIGYEVNRGKGAALRFGIEYIKEHFPDSGGIVTADSDGQHTVKDILKISGEISPAERKLILGIRNFDAGNVPPKSEFGNKITRTFFKIFYGIKITDTQTGLRGIPACLYDWALSLKGDRFEYETNMLIHTKAGSVQIEEIEIETIYDQQNEGTHFRPIRDSFMIYSLLLGQFLKYSLSSLICVAIDFGMYALFSKLLFTGFNDNLRILFSTGAARLISSIVNYTINRNTVFKNQTNLGASLIKYYILCVLQAFASYFLVHILYVALKFIDDVIIKAVVDICLFFVSYFVQQKWVFKSKIKN